MKEEWENFFRNGFACCLHYDYDKDMYFGYIGYSKDHKYYGSLFKQVGSCNLHHFQIKFESSVMNDKWWMGFNIQTTYDKAMAILKKTADLSI